MQKKGGSLPSSFCFALSLLALVSAFSLLHFYFKRFFLVSSFSQAKIKTMQKKNPQRRKKTNKGRSLLSNFRFAFSFLAPTSALSFQVLSPNIFFFSNKRKKKTKKKLFFYIFTNTSKKKKKKKKTTKKKRSQRRKRNVEKVISFPFCIWDEALLLLFPLQIPSTLSSPPSSSLVSTSPRNSMLLKLMSSSKLWRWSEQEMR